MRIKRTFKDQLEANKKLILILMFLVIIIGIIRLFYIRSKSSNIKTQDLNEASFVEIKESVFKNGGTDLIDAIDLYSEIKELDVKDSLKIKEMNDKLDNLIDK